MTESVCGHGCDGSGFIYRDNGLGQALDAIPCECRAETIARRRNARASRAVPDQFRSVALDRRPLVDLDAGSRRVISAFAANIDANVDAGRGLWLAGDPGVGKSCAAAYIAMAASTERMSVGFYNFVNLLGELRETYRDDAPISDAEFLRRIAALDLLIVDDLAPKKLSEWVQEKLYQLLNDRLDNKRSLIITADIDRGEVEARFDRRTVRRLDDLCGKPCILTGRGPDLRVVPEATE